MSWNYRIVRRLDGSFALHEVYYDKTWLPQGMTAEPATFVADADEDGEHSISCALTMALMDAQERGVLDEPEQWPGQALGDDSEPAGRAALAAEGDQT